MATSYWEHRAALRQAAYDRANNKVVEAVSRAYDRTMRQLDKDIDTIMATYTRKTGLSVREAYDFLREGVPQSVMDDLRSRAAVISDPRQRKRLGVMLRTDAYRARISRLDAIKASTRVGLTEAAEVELGALEPHLRHTADLAYSRTMFDIQKATVGFRMVGVPRRALETILKSKWAGTHYSTSVWQNRDAMAGILDRALMEQSSMGKLSDMTMQDVRGMVDLNKWRNQIKSKFKTEAQYQKYAANRLIRTESAYVAGQTTAVAYEECGIERYEYMATLDNRTSAKCADKDGQIFDMADKEVGINWPPLHPHCRSSVAPVIDGLTREGLTRSARDANGKSVYVPRDMKYQEWKRWQDDGAPGDVEAWRKSITNKKSVEQQLNEGEFVIEKLNPKSVLPVNPIRDQEKFQALAYDFETTGYNGRPIVAVDIGDGQYQALTGSHRVYAARTAEIQLPTKVIDYNDGVQELLDAKDDEQRARIAQKLLKVGDIDKEAYRLLSGELEINFEDVPKHSRDVLRKKAELYKAAQKQKEAIEAMEREAAEKARKAAEEKAREEIERSVEMKEFLAFHAELENKYGAANMWRDMTDAEMNKINGLERKAYRK